MAVTLISNYSKKVGLAHYSSLGYSVSVQTEVTDLDRVPGEISRLYNLLQSSVDLEIQQNVGFVPDESYGQNAAPSPQPQQPKQQHQPLHSVAEFPAPGATDPAQADNGNGGSWICSLKQRQLITDLAAELDLSDEQLTQRVRQFSGLPIEKINKLSASNLISSLLEDADRKRKGNRKNAA